VRFRTHLLSSAALGLAVYPRRPFRAALLALAGTLLDLDHLLLYVGQTGDWSVLGALRYDRYRHRRWRPGDARPRYGSLRSWLHRPALVLPPLWMLAWDRPALRPLVLGVSLHLALDHYDWPLRRLALLRAAGRCAGCARQGLRLSTHRRPGADGHTFRALCRRCGEGMPPRLDTPPGALRARRLWYTETE
jgi:hypothetical protein